MNTKLLKIMEEQANLSTKELAILLDIKEEDAQRSIEEMKKDQIIIGTHTLINWEKTNVERVTALIFVSATPQRNVGYDGIAKRIARFKEVESLSLMSGGTEFIVQVKESSMQKIAHFVGSKLAPLEGVKGTATHFVLKQYKMNGFLFEEESEKQERLLFTI